MTEFFPTLFTDMVGKNSVHQNDRQGWKKKRTSHCQEGAPQSGLLIHFSLF